MAAALIVREPLGTADPRIVAVKTFGLQAGRYLGYCPMSLIVYFLAAMLMRHAVAFAAAVQLRFIARQARSGMATRASALAFVSWLLLAAGGALLVGATTGAHGVELKWAVEIAELTALAGLPCMALAVMCALLARRAITFWLVTPALLFFFLMFSFGLHGEGLVPAFPGVIEVGLISGREAQRNHAMMGALAWPLLAWLVTGLSSALRPSNESSPAEQPLAGR